MYRLFNFKRNENGQAMVEFALIFVIVIIIALAIAQFSMILSAQIAVTNAAREGARAASVGAKKGVSVDMVIDGETVTLLPIEDIVENAIGGHGYLDITNLDVTVIGDTKGEPVEVAITGVVVETIVPIPSFDSFSFGENNIVDADDNFALSATASMRLEQ